MAHSRQLVSHFTHSVPLLDWRDILLNAVKPPESATLKNTPPNCKEAVPFVL